MITPNSKIISVSLSEILAFDPLKRGIGEGSLSRLKESIGKTGLLTPLVVFETEGGSYSLISGYRRFLAAKGILNEVEVEVLNKEKVSLKNSMYNVLHGNSSIRDIGIVEASAIVEDFVSMADVSDSELLEKILPLLGFQHSLKTLSMLKALRNLNSKMCGFLSEKSANLSFAFEIARLSSRDIEALSGFWEVSKLSFSKFKSFFEILSDLSVKNEKSIENTLTVINAAGFFKGDKLHATGEKELFSKLDKEKNPCVSEMKESLLKAKEKIQLPQGVELKLPVEFDDMNFGFNLTGNSKEVLLKRLKDLERLIESDDFKELLEI